MTPRSWPTRYGFAALMVALAAGSRIALGPLLTDRVTLITFYPAAMLSAWFGGLGPGVAVTLSAAVIAADLWLTPRDAADVLALALFILVGVVISVLNESLHRGHALERAARHAAEQALEAERTAKFEAERANQVKDRFLASVSHEVRAPLTAILAWSDMLRKHMLEQAKHDEAAEAIYSNARRQNQLIDDLLDVARIVAGTLRVEPAAIDLQAVIEGALEVVRPAADERQVRIEVDVDPALGIVWADPARLQQVLWNLLINAIKFTPPHGTIHVGARRGDSTFELVIRDTGHGIAPEFLPLVFQPFLQAGGAGTRRTRGLGLGLSIAKQLVEAHGGSIGAASDGLGKGSTFTVRLPLVRPETESVRSPLASTPVAR